MDWITEPSKTYSIKSVICIKAYKLHSKNLKTVHPEMKTDKFNLKVWLTSHW